MTEPAVLTERRGDVLVVTLNRPRVRNAVNAAVAAGVGDAMDLLDASPELRAGVLTGAGGSFCSGMDLKAFVEGERPFHPRRGFAGIAEVPSRKPLIAAVEGFAMAGGFEIALACDLLVAAAGARFGIPEVKRGLVAAGGGLLRLPRRLPHNIVMELALAGDPLPAERLHALGLANRVTATGEAVRTALELAAAITVNGPLALAATKEIVEAQYDWGGEEAWQRQAAIAGPIMDSEDAREGARAFKEKRAPAWTGR
jgi:enoyl-CoA hydratase